MMVTIPMFIPICPRGYAIRTGMSMRQCIILILTGRTFTIAMNMIEDQDQGFGNPERVGSDLEEKREG